MTQRSKKTKTLLLLSTAALFTGAAFAQDADPETPPVEEAQEDERRLGPVVVRGAFIPNEKRATSEVSSLLDSQDFQVTGDPDAAAALKRVTGLSVAQGKFVFVRGLNERYSNSTLNGSPLPSPEPLRRVAPLDLFPTSILQTVLVQKTWSPQFSAEFGGGLIDLRTKTIPDEAFLDIGVSGSINAIDSFQDGLLYDGGGNSDFLGFDDGTRNLPADIVAQLASTGADDLSAEDNRRLGLALVSPELSLVQEGIVGPNYGLTLAGGVSFDVTPDVTFGITGTAGYSNSWDTRRGLRRDVNNPIVGGGPVGQGAETTSVLNDDFRRESTENQAKLNGLVSFGVEAFNAHDVSLTALITRSTSKEVRVFEGTEDDDSADIREENFEFFERQLFTVQGRGEHEFPELGNVWNELDDLKIGWRASYSEASRDAPFQSQFLFQEQGAQPNVVIDAPLAIENIDDQTFTFSEIDDEVRDLGVDITLPLNPSWLPGGDAEIKAGWAFLESDRDTTTRIFNFTGSVPSAVLDSRVDFIFSENNITGTPGTGLAVDDVGGVLFPEGFIGSLALDAYYVSGDIQITPFLRIAGGVRFEDALQTSDTVTISGVDNGFIESQLASEFLLPAITATWNFTGNLQFRGGFSQTITRPQFRELAAVQFINSETDVNFFGNPFLVNSEVDNYDARLEWYFDRGQFITIGGFYKDLTNPIEEVGDSATDTLITTFINAPSAQIFGFEFELETLVPLDEWLGLSWLNGRDYVFNTNYSYSDSEVSADGEVTRANTFLGAVTPDTLAGEAFIIEGRSLQGQSDHVVNVQVGYDDEDARSSFRLLFNFASDRIRSAEALVASRAAVIESPPLSLDLTYTKTFDFRRGEYALTLSATNLTGANYTASQSGTDGTSIVVDQYDRGQEISLSLKRKF